MQENTKEVTVTLTEEIVAPFTKEEVQEATLKYFKGDTLATNVWIDKYCLKDSNFNYMELTPDDMHKRLAKEFARIELKYPNPLSYENIYELLRNFKYIIPGGSILYGVGNNYSISSLGNCFSYNTEIITNNGIKKIGDLKNTFIPLLSENGQWVSSKIESFGEQEIVNLIITRSGREQTIQTTKDHIWYALEERHQDSYKEFKTKELKPGYRLKYNFAKNYKAYQPSPFGVAHGFYYGDGDKSGDYRTTKRCKLIGEKKELVSYFTSTPEIYLTEEDYISINGCPNFFSNYPSLKENVGYLYGWLAGYFAADGHITDTGSVIINSSKKEDILFVRDVCSVLGIGYYDIRTQTRESNLTNEFSDIHTLYLMPEHLTSNFFIKTSDKQKFNNEKLKNYWNVKEIIYTDKIEEVFCAIVPGTNNFTLANGILTHNCFAIGNNSDSYGGICITDQEQAQLMKRRAGVGHDLSHLRPTNTLVSNSAGTSTGAISFMSRYSNTTREVAQDGRRGALMLSMDINHPDIEQFITSKDDSTKITGANISVKITDEFMKAVENNSLYELSFWRTDNQGNALYINREKVNAKELWNLIIHQATTKAEPKLWDLTW